ncbi:MAG: DUF5683 domain-containing protein [bacterium]
MRAQFDQEIISSPSPGTPRLEQDNIEPQKRSVLKAALLSAVLPGAGQVYNHSYWSALLFLGIEAGGLYTNFKYNNEGDELTASFEQFADLHWAEPRYWDSLARDSGGKCSANDLQCLRDYERDSFSHFLPATKNQTYYENIGKYDQFNGGWDDGSGDARERDSANRESYTYMRLEANDKYKTATTGITVVIINHLVSALHAAYTTNSFNRTLANSSMGVKMKKYGGTWVPAVSFAMAW